MRSKSRTRRTAPLASKSVPDIVGGRARESAPLNSLAPREDAAVSAYEREIDRLDAAVQER